MPLRAKYNEELDNLYLSLIKMGALSEDALESSMSSLFDQDETMVSKTNEIEQEIDKQQKNIEQFCVKLILEQQPVASDLRMISTAMKMIIDLERIGDIAEDITEVTCYITDETLISEIPLKEMASEVSSMVGKSVESFVKKDENLAKKVIENDDKVDKQLADIQVYVMNEIRNGSRDGIMCMDVMIVAKYLERIADHAVNVAESVIYSVTGEHVYSD